MTVFEDQELEDSATRVVEKAIHGDEFDKTLPVSQTEHVEMPEEKA